MRDNFFTNIQRELDVGTISLRNSLETHSEAPAWVKVANCALFRWLRGSAFSWNHVVGGWIDWSDTTAVANAMSALLDAWLHRPPTIFGRAGQPPTGHGRVPVSEMLSDRLPTVIPALSRHLDEIVAGKYLTSLEPIFDEIGRLNLHGFQGKFVVLQLALDLQYVYPHVSDDEWIMVRFGTTRTTSVGPAVTLRKIASTAKMDHEDNLNVVRWLRDIQTTEFDRLCLPWSNVSWSGKTRLTLGDIEHSLCEFDKYERLLVTGRGGRRYKHSAIA